MLDFHIKLEMLDFCAVIGARRRLPRQGHPRQAHEHGQHVGHGWTEQTDDITKPLILVGVNLIGETEYG